MTQASDCCAKFDPTPYEDKTLEWKEKPFIKESMPTFMHMPYPGKFGKVVGRMWKKIDAAGVRPENKDFVMLCCDPTPWRSELFITTTGSVPDAENVTLSGNFMTRVFDGPFRDIRKWVGEMQNWVASEGKKMDNLYFYYTTCPKCSKKWGHNYVVGFARVS